MATKVFFTGNPLAGDDGIGPFLFHELENDARLKGVELEETGVIGFDMISYIKHDDKIIIVDAMRQKNNPTAIKHGSNTNPRNKEDTSHDPTDNNGVGSIVILQEEDLTPELSLVSQHDFGIEETARVIRMYYPNLPKIQIIGIVVNDTQPFSNQLSSEMESRLPDVKDNVVKAINKFKEDATSKNPSQNIAARGK